MDYVGTIDDLNSKKAQEQFSKVLALARDDETIELAEEATQLIKDIDPLHLA